MPNEKPIIFSGESVRAILDGKKTQTRRVINPQPPQIFDKIPATFKCMIGDFALWENGFADWQNKVPRQPGDKLWVRETWARRGDKYYYRADSNCEEIRSRADCECPKNQPVTAVCELCEAVDGYVKWHSPLFMPREAARIFLRVTNVRVERVQDISDSDAKAEGCTGIACNHPNITYSGGMAACTDCMNTGWLEPPSVEYAQLWDKLNAKRGYSWETNPFVWVIEFERITDYGIHT